MSDNLHHVSVKVPQIVLYDDLNIKINEISVKRNALMLSHNYLNKQQDFYNKFIIILSLMSAFFESTKAQLHLSQRDDWIAPVSVLAPILLSTVLGIISSLMKFKKFPEKMELLTKATEKCNATILNMRKLNENLNFQSYETSYDEYNRNVTPAYRDALDYYEKSLYPHEQILYLTKSIKLADDTIKRETVQKENIVELLNKDKQTIDDTMVELNSPKNTVINTKETAMDERTIIEQRDTEQTINEEHNKLHNDSTIEV